MPAKPCTTRNKIFEALTNQPLTVSEIANITGLDYRSVGSTVGKLRETRRMYIAVWRPSVGAKIKCPVPAYLVGDNDDAPRPPRSPRVRPLSSNQRLAKLLIDCGTRPSVFGQIVSALT